MSTEHPLIPWSYLRIARLRAKHTPKSAAEALRLGLSHYCSMEAGRYGASEATLIKLADLYEVDIAELVRTAPRPRRNGPSRTSTGQAAAS